VFSLQRTNIHFSPNNYISALVVALVSIFSASVSVNAAVPTSASVINDIRSAKILSKDLSDSLTVRITGSEITVSAYRSPKSSDQDCKIDAVLIAKELVSKYRSITVVRAVFFDMSAPTNYRTCVVRAGDIDLFGSGALSKENLFKMINVAHEKHGSAKPQVRAQDEALTYHVVPGFHAEDREQTLINLKKIVKAGGDISDLWPYFKQIENMVKDYKTEEIVEPFNQLSLLVSRRTGQVNSAIIRRNEELTRLQNAEASRLAAKYVPQPGYAYARRMAIGKAIRDYRQIGRDMSWYQRRLIEQIEPLARANRDHVRVDDMLGELERALNLSPGTSE
jgi:hypothetical protein